MGLFKSGKKRITSSKEQKQIIEKLNRKVMGHRLADEAISYRNIGKYEKSLKLLKKSLFEFDYKPAISIIGVTLALKGDVNKAISWLSENIEKLEKQKGYPIIELYANLGWIFSSDTFGLKKYDTAIDMYYKALSAPLAQNLSEDYYTFEIGNVYRDMAIVYYKSGDLSKAREYAQKRLETQPECIECRKLIELCG